VLLAWLLSGTLDITTAILYYVGLSGPRAERLLQGIASGVLGRQAFVGGVGTALLGLTLHYFIALIWTLVLFVVFRIYPRLRRLLVLTGIIDGVVVWFAMNLVVVPLSRVQHGPIQPVGAITGAIILVLCIGLPNALVIGRHVPDAPQR
jgi:hypothetical protein